VVNASHYENRTFGFGRFWWYNTQEFWEMAKIPSNGTNTNTSNTSFTTSVWRLFLLRFHKILQVQSSYQKLNQIWFLERDKWQKIAIQAALVICGLFICDFAYLRSRNGLFSGTYHLIYSNPWSFYMRIRYMRAYFWSPYLSLAYNEVHLYNNNQ